MPFPLPIILQQAVQQLLGRLPDLWINHDRSRDMERLWANVRYLADIVDRMNARSDDTLRNLSAGQLIIIRDLIATLQPLNQRLESLAQPAIALPYAVNSQEMNAFIGEASNRLEPELPQAATLAPEDALDVLVRLVRWQMADVDHLVGNPGSIHHGDWCILGYRNSAITFYYIAVCGTDPASAQIRYYRHVRGGASQGDDWQGALQEGDSQFSSFIALPGSGIYHLAARLAADGIEAD